MNRRPTFVGYAMLAALLALGAYAVVTSPDSVPTSWGFDGKVAAMGSKWTLLVLPALGAIAFAVLALVRGRDVRLPFAIPEDRVDAVEATVDRGLGEMMPAFAGGFFAVEFVVLVSSRTGILSPLFVPAILLCVAAIVVPIATMYAHAWRLART